MPRDTHFIETTESSTHELPQVARLLPVASVAAVWSVALREYRIEKVERLPLRARMLDMLEHLDRGQLLALMGATVPAVWLDGHPDIALLAGVLFCYGYVEIAGRHRDNANIVYFSLSPEGRRKLREGRAWWNALSFWQRLKVSICG
jgi:hypothetical protein